jgi:hypothetical protein
MKARGSLGSLTSAQFASILTDAVGSGGGFVRANSPTFLDAAINQAANGDNTLTLQRFTDTTPTGNFLAFLNATNGVIAYINVAGDFTTNGVGSFIRLGVGAAADASHFLLLNGGTITTDKHLIDALVTWNAGGTTFTALKLNVTNTASAASSMLVDLQVGGSSMFSLQTSDAGASGMNMVFQTIASARGSGAVIGSWIFNAHDGTAFGEACDVLFQTAGTWTTSSHGGRIVFRTTPTGSTTIAEVMRIQNTGGVSIGTSTDPGIGKLTVLTAYNVGSSQVIAARVTGYTAMTGSLDKATAYATSTVTLPQLAGRVAQLQADLTTHGLIGA